MTITIDDVEYNDFTDYAVCQITGRMIDYLRALRAKHGDDFPRYAISESTAILHSFLVKHDRMDLWEEVRDQVRADLFFMAKHGML